MKSKFLGTGCYIPDTIKTNEDFLNNIFLDDEGHLLSYNNDVVISKFKDVTGIEERRYAENNLLTSDLGTKAAQNAIDDAGIDKEELDYIIFAHNFGNVKADAIQIDILPSLATRVKHNLQIKNPKCVAYDILYGCPGWIQGVIQADAFIKAGIAKKCLVIGAETLSRVIDQHDRDSMIYSDGAGACVLGISDDDSGILAHSSATYTYDEAYYLHYGSSNNKKINPNVRYIKMHGRKIYEFALSNVPLAMQACLVQSSIPIEEVKKVLIHQANEKMDEAIIHRFFKLYGKRPPENVMPMSIHKLGNSSVATVPTLYDLIKKNKIENQQIKKGDVLILASVGSGMSINSIIYRE